MKNYWLEYIVEKDNLDLPWDPARVRSLESMVKPTAQFSVDLDDHFGQRSILDYGRLIHSHKSGSCDQDKVRAWVYSSLLRKAVQDANAVALLRSKSLWNQALNLWRSLFETEVVCNYIGNSSLGDHLACRYVIHSKLRKSFRRWEQFNETCRRLGKDEEYSAAEIQIQKDAYREEFEDQRGDYAWTRKRNHDTFEKIAQATNSDMLFYRIASNEVHPTFGEDASVIDTSLPIPVIPLLPVGVAYDEGELLLEFQTANSLNNTINRVTDYTTMPVELQHSLTDLKKLAEEVLRGLFKAGASGGRSEECSREV